MKPFTTLGFTLILHFFVHAQIPRYSVVINELLADPSPVVGLPNTEFIELRNNSKQAINLYKWRISNGTTSATIGINYILGPDSLVVICSKTQAIFFNGITNLIGVTSFPALTNDGDEIALYAADGTTIHAVLYSVSDYHNSLKANGGWSLELIDPFRGCDKHNWTASTYFAGGTPGKENSVFKKSTATEKVMALQAITVDSMRVQLHLDQGVDSVSNTDIRKYQFSPTQEMPSKISLIPPLFNIIELQFKTPLKDNVLYQIKALSLKQCTTNELDTLLFQTGIIHEPKKDELVINEILFDPPSGGSDFIELYNKSGNIFNAKHLHLSNRTAANQLGPTYTLTEIDYNIFPGEYVCLTTDSAFVCSQWPLTNKQRLILMKGMPSYPDDEGVVVLLNNQGEIMDECRYQDNMHFPLIRNREGVSLERISPNLPSNYMGNWHSAASNVGYASPGYQNSQFQSNDSIAGKFSLSTEVISPNNDGTDDNLIIFYTFPSSGYMCSAYLFDQRGVLLQKICDNILCGIEGQIIWNGTVLDQKTPSGLYYIKLEAFHLNGSRVNRKWAVGVE